MVFADPDNRPARELRADALEQLGYQAEPGPWRNFHLSAAQELRGGVRVVPTPNTTGADTVRAMSIELFFDYLGVRLDGGRAGDRRLTLICALPDTGEADTLLLRNGALSHRPGAHEGADASVTIARADLDDVILGAATLADQVAAGRATVDGDASALEEFLGLLDTFEFWFSIVTP